MIKKSITIKIFLFIIVLFALQMLIQYTFQNYLLADYYENEKITSIEEALSEIITAFKETSDIKEQSKLLDEFIEIYDQPLLVIDEYYGYHPASYESSFEQTLSVDIDGTEYILPIFDVIDSDENYFELNPNIIGETIEILGFEDQERFYPIGFDMDGYFVYTMSYEEENDYFIEDYEETFKQGFILDYDELQMSQSMQTKLDVLINYYDHEVYGEVIEYDDSVYEIITDSLYTDGIQYQFLTMVSLQPINEVLNIQSSFQNYLFIGMTLLILIVAFAMSKIVSKPIIEISETTREIAKLNFEAYCDESRSDEIGILGTSINHLSNALKSKIEDLEVTNKKLLDDIEFERKQELIRKEFVANVSHELKTPLGVIESYSEGIKDGISKEKETYYLEVIIEEVQKMNYLISDMLQLSNLESGIQKDQLEKINLKRVIQNLLRSYEPVILQEKILLEVDLDELMIEVDVRQFESVCSNLLSNAFRYVDDQKRIKISIKNNCFEIENSSENMAQEDLEKLWDRFFRIEKSRTRALGGNGLGLSIVKSILDRYSYEYQIINKDQRFIFRIRF